jgi:hypothetical protein
MKKLPVLAISAPLLLIGAAHPDLAARHDPAAAHPVAATAGPVTYRPCRPGAGDDRCIQLYERGVRASYARWLRERRGEQLAQAAVGGPDTPAHRARRHPPSRNRSAGPVAHHSGQMRCHEPPADREAPRAHDVEGDETRGM